MSVTGKVMRALAGGIVVASSRSRSAKRRTGAGSAELRKLVHFALDRALRPPNRTHFSLLDPTPRRGSRRRERREKYACCATSAALTIRKHRGLSIQRSRVQVPSSPPQLTRHRVRPGAEIVPVGKVLPAGAARRLCP